MSWISRVLLIACVPLAGCGADPTTSCDDFEIPDRDVSEECQAVGNDPRILVSCALGSGYAGRWAIDDDGLPMYELAVEERCDPAGRDGNVFGRGPVHLIGNGRGLMAVAHASGAVEVFSQDRGHKWLNHVDRWKDSERPGYPQQVGGGWSYIVDDDGVHSTRHADLFIGPRADAQRRRLGVGYFETITQAGRFIVRRRVFAPDFDTRALVAEVSVTNLGDQRAEIGLVEMWDVNIHQLSGAFDEVPSAEDVEGLRRHRRGLQSRFEHRASWDASKRVASVATTALELPASVSTPSDLSDLDYFPDPVFLAVADQGTFPDAVWLSADELWGSDDSKRKIPGKLEGSGNPDTRNLELQGVGQPAALAVRVPLELPPGTTVTRRFAFGTTLADQSAAEAADAIRAQGAELSADAAAKWRDSLVWASLPEQEDSGAMQRELAWASYHLQAAAGYNRQLGGRVVSQGGAMRFLYGLEGAIGDVALLGETLSLIDPGLARETIGFALSTQHGSQSPTPSRFPYGETGVRSFADVPGQEERSDAYFLVPGAVSNYLAFSRDFDFLDQAVSYWPPGETGSVASHLRATVAYISGTLGNGARGLAALGTGDYTDGLLAASPVLATADGTSSTFNAMLAAERFEVLADMLAPFDGSLAQSFRDIWTTQVSALSDSSSGGYYYRGFVDGGGPLLDDYVFALPQALAILSRLVVGQDARDLLSIFEDDLEVGFGVLSDSGPSDGSSGALLGHVRPSVASWAVQAAMRVDAARGWDLLLRSMPWSRVQLYPNLWYGIWTGAEVYQPSGEAGVSLATGYGNEPALNVHGHAASIRNLMAALGLRATGSGIRIDPRIPGEGFYVIFPFFELQGTPFSIGGSITASGSYPLLIEVVLPSGLRAGTVRVVVDGEDVSDYVRDGDTVRVNLPASPGAKTRWVITSGDD